MKRSKTFLERHANISIGLGVALLLFSVSGCSFVHNAMIMDMEPIQFGIASWYSNEFHGKKTSSGEIYNKNDFTGAHRTLPFGTPVKVTNIKNGRTTIIRINDRGPKRMDRKIDLSYAAAEKLGMIRDGIARVKLEVLGEVESKVLYSNLIYEDQMVSNFKREKISPYLADLSSRNFR